LLWNFLTLLPYWNRVEKTFKDLSPILSNDLKWLIPYLEVIRDLVPFRNIKKIQYYKHRTCWEFIYKKHHLAITHQLANNKTYLIYIRTMLPKEKRIPLDKDEQEDVLWFLAHELAHCVPGGWEHTKEHFRIMSEIFYRFGKILHLIDFENERNRIK